MGKEHKRLLPLPVRLSTAFLPNVQILYDATLPSKKQEQYERGLHDVKRQETIRSKGFLLSPTETESDLEHTVAGLLMAKNYVARYPVLGSYIDFEKVQIMYGMHDCGEISVGDVTPIDRTPKDEQRKRLEPYLAERYIFSQIPDAERRRIVTAYYRRYQANDPNDLEVQMARFIDKAQGTTQVAAKAFNVYAAKSNSVKIEIANHLWHTVPQMMEPALNLLVGLAEHDARNAMKQIILSELSELEKYGPKEVARTYMRGIQAVAA